MPYHNERWDSTFFVGGPVWSMEWCPCPDGSTGNQYVVVYSHRDMDARHRRQGLHTEPGLLQLWDLGELNNRYGWVSKATQHRGLETLLGDILVQDAF